MQPYSVLYAEDVPLYALGEIAARNDASAIRKAKKMDTDQFQAYEPDWDGSVCKRIVWIEDDQHNQIATDIPLDSYHLMRDVDNLLCDAAPVMLRALLAVHRVIRQHGLGDDDREAERVVSLIVAALTAAGRAP